MNRVQGPEAVSRAYQDDRLAEEYLESRYENNGLLKSIHQAQMRILHRFLRGRESCRVLEIACGPARITAELTEVRHGVAIDQSEPMLRIAERRLKERKLEGWSVLRGDAFNLQFDDAEFDVVLTFKLLRHFDSPYREKLVKEIERVLKPNGFLLFDAVNAPACQWLYQKWGLTHSWIDDFHFTAHELRLELEEQRFRAVRLHPVQRPIVGQYALFTRAQQYLPNWASAFGSRTLNWLPFGMPLEWVVECRRA